MKLHYFVSLPEHAYCDQCGKLGFVRKLPWGSHTDGQSILCKTCFKAELENRREFNRTHTEKQTLPLWRNLKPYPER